MFFSFTVPPWLTLARTRIESESELLAVHGHALNPSDPLPDISLRVPSGMLRLSKTDPIHMRKRTFALTSKGPLLGCKRRPTIALTSHFRTSLDRPFDLSSACTPLGATRRKPRLSAIRRAFPNGIATSSNLSTDPGSPDETPLAALGSHLNGRDDRTAVSHRNPFRGGGLRVRATAAAYAHLLSSPQKLSQKWLLVGC